MRSTTKHVSRSTRTLAAAIAAVALVFGAGCSSGPKSGTAAGNDRDTNPHAAVTTTDADWKPVADALGRTGKLGDNNTAYRVALPRNDVQVTSYGVAVKPGLSLGGYAAFARYAGNETLMMGDLVVTEAELPKVTDALQAHGIAQTALHKHLLDGGLLKYSIPREDAIVEDGHVLPPASLNLTTVINFQSVGAGRAAINGDFILTEPEVQKVIQALRAGNIQIVELHNHGLTERPRLFYMHFWAVDDAVSLARALRPALDATNLKPA